MLVKVQLLMFSAGRRKSELLPNQEKPSISKPCLSQARYAFAIVLDLCFLHLHKTKLKWSVVECYQSISSETIDLQSIWLLLEFQDTLLSIHIVSNFQTGIMGLSSCKFGQDWKDLWLEEVYRMKQKQRNWFSKIFVQENCFLIVFDRIMMLVFTDMWIKQS